MHDEFSELDVITDELSAAKGMCYAFAITITGAVFVLISIAFLVAG